MNDKRDPQEFYPLIVSMMATKDYAEQVAASMVLGYLEALKDGFVLVRHE